MGKLKKFIGLAIVAAIAVVIVAVFADESVVKNATNYLLTWIAGLFNLPAVNIF